VARLIAWLRDFICSINRGLHKGASACQQQLDLSAIDDRRAPISDGQVEADGFETRSRDRRQSDPDPLVLLDKIPYPRLQAAAKLGPRR
jgi:hypothetical protein